MRFKLRLWDRARWQRRDCSPAARLALPPGPPVAVRALGHAGTTFATQLFGVFAVGLVCLHDTRSGHLAFRDRAREPHFTRAPAEPTEETSTSRCAESVNVRRARARSCAKSKQQPIATRDGGDPAHPTGPGLPGRPCRHAPNHVPPHPGTGAQARARKSAGRPTLAATLLLENPWQAFMPEQQQAPPPQDDDEEEEEEPEAPPPAPPSPLEKGARSLRG